MARPSKGRTFWAAALMVGTTLAGAWCQSANAQSRASATRSFDIPAQSLPTALAIFGRQSGMQVSVPASLPDGRTSSAVSGSMGAAEALSRLLAGTGLSNRIDGNIVTLTQAPVADGAIELGPVRVEGASASTGGANLPGPVITEETQSYTTPQISVMKGQSRKDTPHSVSVVTRQQIEDQSLNTLSDVLDRTVGVTVTQKGASTSSFGNDNVFYSRGFAINNFQTDGGASTSAAFGGWAGSVSQLDMAQYDHVELVRGVDGLYSSTGEPGGTINLVRKQALAETGANFALIGGSWNYYRAEGDVTGAVTKDGRLRARAGIAYENRRYFYDMARNERIATFANLAFDITPDTLLTAGVSYQRDSGIPFAGGLPRYSNGADIGLPRSTALIPAWNRSEERAEQYYARLEHRFGETWQATFSVDQLNIDRDAQSIFNNGAIDPITLTGEYFFAFPAKTGSNRTSLNANLKGSFFWLGGEHQVTLGGDYEKSTAISHQSTNDVSGTEFDIFSPIVLPVTPDNGLSNKWDYDMTRKALYGSAKVELLKRVHLIFGGRLSSYAYSYTVDYFSDGAVTSSAGLNFKKSSVFTPYGAITVALNDNWTSYASYAETYTPQTQLKGPPPGEFVDPIESRNYEVGVKGELADGKLNASFALYRIERTGEVVVDDRYPIDWATSCCYVNRGRIISQGFDVELTGQILPGWEVASGYTYNANRNERDDDARYSTITPKHLLKIWTSYRFQGELSRLKVGAGVTAQSAHFVTGTATTYDADTGTWSGADVPYRFNQPAYALVNMSAEYKLSENVGLTVNLNNVLDKSYYQTVGTSARGNFYGEPRSFRVTLRGKF